MYLKHSILNSHVFAPPNARFRTSTLPDNGVASGSTFVGVVLFIKTIVDWFVIRDEALKIVFMSNGLQ